MIIKFTEVAIESLKDIKDFLDNRWTQKEIKLLEKDIEKLIRSFNDKIISYPTVDFDKRLQFALLGKKQVKVYFDVQSESVEILLFFPSKGNPEDIRKLLDK